jgi:SsrA-binding protein
MELKKNKKAYFDYQHVATYESGIQLTGAEVKSVKMGLINLDGSYITIKDGQAWLLSAKIPLYPKASTGTRQEYNPERPRRLLMTKNELISLTSQLSQRGLTIVPLYLYSSRRLVKVKLALAKGKRKFDKRAAIKEKEYRRRLNSRPR